MNVDQYFSRIKYSGSPKRDFATLSEIHYQHLLHIPYENVDVQLGRPLDFDIQSIFKKLVTNHRGGWCYEMNGLLGWALEQVGFEVTRMSGAVNRASLGDEQLGNHLVLKVILDRAYIVDVGLGDGLRHPIPLIEGSYDQSFLRYRLELRPDGYWRFHNHPFSNVDSFDFKDEIADEELLMDKCIWLQSSEDSLFKRFLIAQKFTPSSITVQIGKIFSVVTKDGKQTEIIESPERMNSHMFETFGVSEDFHSLWPKIEVAHENLVNAENQKVDALDSPSVRGGTTRERSTPP